MVKRFFNIFYKEISGLHEAAYLLGLFALLSQILGLFRDRMLASSFGTGEFLDIYYSSFRIPDFIFVSVASIVSLSVLIPFITERMNHGEEETKKFIGSIFSFFSILIVSTSVIVYFLVPYLIPFIFKGMQSSPHLPELILMTRILLLSPILLGLSNFFGGITQVGKRFLIYALSPIFYNLGIILGIIFFYPIYGIYGLAYGVVLGAFMHLAIQLPFVSISKLFSLRVLKINWLEIKKIIVISIPRTITLGMSQFSILILLGIASLMEKGSITVFNFAFNLQSVPLSIIGVSYSVAAFPMLSKLFIEGNKEKFLENIVTGARHIIFWSVPISVLFIVLRAQIVRVIYGAGHFDWSSTKLVAATLAIFAISVLAQSLILLFVRGYYATGDTSKSLWTSILSCVFTIVFSFGFIKLFDTSLFFKYFIENLFRVDGLLDTSVLMLALGFSLASIVNCIMLWIMFEKSFKGFSKPVLGTLFQSFSASVIMGSVSYLCLNLFVNVFNINTFFGIFGQGFVAGTIGIASGVIILYLLGSEELMETWHTLHMKFWKVKTIVPETTEL
ncbi:MAG: murein biosynthesis integral membrane protein MurJ [Minisyncoccia bacterium]